MLFRSWEDPINEMLIYEPFLSTSATRRRGRKYSHPMIGDLEGLFHDNLTDVQITYRLCWGPNWRMIPKHVKTNVRDLAKLRNDEDTIQTFTHCGRGSRHTRRLPHSDIIHRTTDYVARFFTSDMLFFNIPVYFIEFTFRSL